MADPPSAGQFVKIRSRLHLVEGDPVKDGGLSLVRLSCIDPDAQGHVSQVLWERELDAEIVQQRSSWRVEQFDAPDLFAAYYRTQRWNCVTSTRPELFQSPHRAGIQLHVYQLEPLRKALRLPRVNLFVADDVGLGKTIEAGLILRELILRQRVRRIVIAVPPSVVTQWREEMESRFGLSFMVYDRTFVNERRQERGYSVNPWLTHDRFLISHALLRDEAYAAPLRDALHQDGRGSLLILDEAHNAAPASNARNQRYAVDSHLTHAVREVAELFEHRLFLSATPHNGHSNSFSALLEILDPYRFIRGIEVTKSALQQTMVRRLKSDLRAVGESFPARVVEQIPLTNLPDETPELALSRLLEQYRLAREARLKSLPRQEQNLAHLVLISLQKRLLSSVFAFHKSLEKHRKGLLAASKSAPPAARQLRLLANNPTEEHSDEELSEEEREAEEGRQMEAASQALAGGVSARERDLLDQMMTIARTAANQPDERVKYILAWIREHLCPGLSPHGPPYPTPPPWLDRVAGRSYGARLLVFTEYDDTRKYLVEQIRNAIEGTAQSELRIASFHGTIHDPREREEIKRAFNDDPADHPLRILVATDAAREGVNLQNHCADLIHFDIPWNPSRLEQRNGRIDRKLQREESVTCRYFVYAQREVDAVLQAVARKTVTIGKELGSFGTVLEAELVKLLDQGIPLSQAASLATQIDALQEDGARAQARHRDLEDQREDHPELERQIKDLRTSLNTSAKLLHLDGGQLRRTLDAALRLMGAPTLKPLPSPPVLAGQRPLEPFAFPPLDQKDPSWVETLDALRTPRDEQSQDLRTWRLQAPLRPVVFEATDSLDAKVVHLHLEHRIVQRLLGRFLAQGFLHHDLSRAVALTFSPHAHEAEPHVLLVGRLALFGQGAARLHEQLIFSAALWQEPAQRKRLTPLGVDRTDLVIQNFEDALREGVTPPKKRLEHLLPHARIDAEALLDNLTQRAASAEREALELLERRATAETKAITDLLSDQRSRLQTKLKEEHAQIALLPEERRQRESEERYWSRRLSSFETDQKAEIERITGTYRVVSRRFEPLGLVYLWPTTG